jgi:hypothetical protein
MRILKSCCVFVASLGLTVSLRSAAGQTPRIEPLPAPRYTITLGARDACVTPRTHIRARADGGVIDVQLRPHGALEVALTGTPAADSYMGCTSTATQTFRLVQEFDVSCSDPNERNVSLTLSSTLCGYVRSMRKAAAGVQLASASVIPRTETVAPLVLSHPPLGVSGTQARLCNQQLPPAHGPPMPLGKFTLVADFVLDTTASGICNAHAVADFSPDTSLPADWVRMRDPFQGASKKSFGFIISLTTGPPAAVPPSASAPSQVRHAALLLKGTETGTQLVFDRSDTPRSLSQGVTTRSHTTPVPR